MRKKLPDITVALDFGGSGSKIIYSTEKDGTVGSLFMEPEVAKVPMESLKRSLPKLGVTDPENVCWVQCALGTRAVGYLAASKYHGNAGLHELKYERAVYKALGAIWAIKERHQLRPRLRVAVAVLLPAGEYENAVRFKELLCSSAIEYQTLTGQMNVEVVMFLCLPEGAGIYLEHEKNLGAALKQKTIAAAMVGYRNASLLVSERGLLGGASTSDMGFVRMLEKVVEQTSGQTVESLVGAIAAAGVNLELKPLQRVLLSTTQENRVIELNALTAAIKSSRAMYATMLIEWLDSVMPRTVDEIVFCGGTAEYIRQELRDRYLGKAVLWNPNMGIPVELNVKDLGTRLCDVYGAYLHFYAQVCNKFAPSKLKALEVGASG